MQFKNIEALVDGSGEISIGRFGPVSCAAVASDEGGNLAMLVRRPRESLQALLARLDAAIEKAWDEEIFTDEINN